MVWPWPPAISQDGSAKRKANEESRGNKDLWMMVLHEDVACMSSDQTLRQEE